MKLAQFRRLSTGRRSSARLTLGRDVLLFFEDRDRDTFIRGDRRLRKVLRKTVALARPNKQRVSGFEMSFRLLKRALATAGQNVYVNDVALALANPDFPIGICGYNHILDEWNLPNPAVLGPGLCDHPKQNITLLHDPRFRLFIVLCDWMRDLFASGYDADALAPWFGGIWVPDWPDTRNASKDLDFLVYDKIRWNREHLVPAFRQPLLAELSRRALTFEVLRYGKHTHAKYRELLKRSRAMLFLCEHETQGMAYQEALASNVPVLAWDNGYWLDPNRPRWETEPVRATSVPYFSEDCGERFQGLRDFAKTLDRFCERLCSYEPREYVARTLSPARSAELYLSAYYRAARMPSSTVTVERSLRHSEPSL
jgi:hypothetical protein